jgi:hypothetical protein
MLINTVFDINKNSSGSLLIGTVALLSLFAPSPVVVGGLTLILLGATAIGNVAMRRVVSVQSVSPLLYPVVTATSGLTLVFGAALALQPVLEIRWSAGAALSMGVLLSVAKVRHHIFKSQNIT